MGAHIFTIKYSSEFPSIVKIKQKTEEVSGLSVNLKGNDGCYFIEFNNQDFKGNIELEYSKNQIDIIGYDTLYSYLERVVLNILVNEFHGKTSFSIPKYGHLKYNSNNRKFRQISGTPSFKRIYVFLYLWLPASIVPLFTIAIIVFFLLKLISIFFKTYLS